PDGELVAEVEVDRFEEIGGFQDDDIEPYVPFDSFPREFRAKTEFLCRDREILLQDLHGKASAASVRNSLDQALCAFTFCRSVDVVGIEKDIRINETCCGHESRPASISRRANLRGWWPTYARDPRPSAWPPRASSWARRRC